MKDVSIDTRSQRMLELLAQGAGSKLIAKELGYQDGTMRVYLHNLYRKLGVANKTEAVIWYLKRGGSADRSGEPAVVLPRPGDDPAGEMALAEGLYAMLGVMGQYLGPYGRGWEIATRAAGEDLERDSGRGRSRALWNALLKGDFAYAKAAYDLDEGYGVLSSSASDGVLLTALLVAGGYSHAAHQLASKLSDRRRSRPAVPAREATLLEIAFEAFEGKQPGTGIARLQKSAEASAAPPHHRHLAMALLFHAARTRRDFERARQVANALWVEAEAARKELQGSGEHAAGGQSQRRGSTR
jgi:DNA-binding CsgD family transcriptional regulator